MNCGAELNKTITAGRIIFLPFFLPKTVGKYYKFQKSIILIVTDILSSENRAKKQSVCRTPRVADSDKAVVGKEPSKICKKNGANILQGKKFCYNKNK